MYLFPIWSAVNELFRAVHVRTVALLLFLLPPRHILLRFSVGCNCNFNTKFFIILVAASDFQRNTGIFRAKIYFTALDTFPVLNKYCSEQSTDVVECPRLFNRMGLFKFNQSI